MQSHGRGDYAQVDPVRSSCCSWDKAYVVVLSTFLKALREWDDYGGVIAMQMDR